jgi:hypothetical protein
MSTPQLLLVFTKKKKANRHTGYRSMDGRAVLELERDSLVVQLRESRRASRLLERRDRGQATSNTTHSVDSRMQGFLVGLAYSVQDIRQGRICRCCLCRPRRHPALHHRQVGSLPCARSTCPVDVDTSGGRGQRGRWGTGSGVKQEE